MIFRNISREDLQSALEAVSQRYSGNVVWNREPEPVGRGFRATIKVLDSKGPGHRRGFPHGNADKGKRMASACWHVHGEFFDSIFDIAPGASVKSGDLRITANGGNWKDRNIGSQMRPLMFSEACDCADEPVKP